MNRIIDENVLFRPYHWGWIVTAFVTIVIVGVADYVTGPHITFSVFYLVPVSVAAWLAGTKGALVGSVVAAVVWFVALFAGCLRPSESLRLLTHGSLTPMAADFPVSQEAGYCAPVPAFSRSGHSAPAS